MVVLWADFYDHCNAALNIIVTSHHTLKKQTKKKKPSLYKIVDNYFFLFLIIPNILVHSS